MTCLVKRSIATCTQLFAFDKEACESGSVRRIAAALGYHVNHEIPGAGLRYRWDCVCGRELPQKLPLPGSTYAPQGQLLSLSSWIAQPFPLSERLRARCNWSTPGKN